LAGQIFNPNTSIDKKNLFSGRTSQIQRAADVIFQRGQHAIIFGERGVGKTSLAQVLQEFLPMAQNLLVTRVTCITSDNFMSVWKKVFDGIKLTRSGTGVGYSAQEQYQLYSPQFI
jgi:ABC-type transport system involved in cytochrome bd biosynthesis fused ATPase/permease subunit